MPSFSKMAIWPVGYFRGISAWLLRERREIASRLKAINAEISRIGFINVSYLTREDEGGSTRATENRLSLTVEPGTSLGKLLQAYIACGGNPFDISGFFMPGTTEIIESDDGAGPATYIEKYPGGGLVTPVAAEYNYPLPEPATGDGEIPATTGYEAYPGGHLNTIRYYPARMGGNVDRGEFDSTTVVRQMNDLRRWNNQAIKERLQDMEWRIIKLMDLREQLVHERDTVLVQAFGGLIDDLPDFDEEQFEPGLRVQTITATMYEMIFETDDAQRVIGAHPSARAGFIPFTFADVPEESAFSL